MSKISLDSCEEVLLVGVASQDPYAGDFPVGVVSLGSCEEV